MKLEYPYLVSDKRPIDSVENYLLTRQVYDEINQDILHLQLAIKQEREQGKTPNQSQFERLDELNLRKKEIRSDFFRRQPNVLISICPYCHTLVWMKVGIFSLQDEFWYREYSDGREEVTDQSRCEHLFCVDGALNLNNQKPTEAQAPITASRDYIYMGAEVPFIKARVLSLPTMVAVIHSFPVADKYRAYPIVYYTQQFPPQEDFCLGWARTEYVDNHKAGGGIIMVGKRSDVQEYDLEHWILQGKVLWVNPDDENSLLKAEDILLYPYNYLSGRRNPYVIKNGRIKSLRNTNTNSSPKIRLER